MMSLRLLPVCSITAIAAMTILASSCGGDRREGIPDIQDTRNYPTMLTTDVSTFVSDSGYTRYHITAPLWIMYEEADTPHWRFPDGLFMEKYDDDMNPTATFTSDSATYMSQHKIWRFDGNVHMVNTDGDRFDTPQLFWDQNHKRVYSDSFMHIERTERIIEGYGFESNEAMTEYTVMNPQMILPIDRMRADRERRDSLSAVNDTVSEQAPATPQPAAALSKSPATPTAAPPRRRKLKSGDTPTQVQPTNDVHLRHTDPPIKQQSK